MQPKLVRKATAAAVAETTAAALAEHEATRRANLEMSAAAFDKALGLDPLAEGRTKGAAAGDPLREGIIDLSAADAAWVAELGLSLGFSPAQGDAPEQHSVFLDVHDDNSTPPPVLASPPAAPRRATAERLKSRARGGKLRACPRASKSSSRS